VKDKWNVGRAVAFGVLAVFLLSPLISINFSAQRTESATRVVESGALVVITAVCMWLLVSTDAARD
jgi:hypothetical protein